jgi:transcriptional regulator GlxA family with amidase domain
MQSTHVSARILVIQFKSKLITQFAEMEVVNKMLKQATQGLLFAYAQQLDAFMKDLAKRQPAEQLITLFELLHRLALRDDRQALCSELFALGRLGDIQLSRLNKVIDFIHQNLNRNIKLREIAALSCMTEPSFSRWFKKAMDCNFIHYVGKCRIEQASRMLVVSDRKVGLIAEDCGFDSLSSFNRAFKKFKGCSPMQFRKLASMTKVLD